MSIRNLEFMIHPSSVALVGAIEDQPPVGALLARNLCSAGFEGDIFMVNSNGGSVEGIPTYPEIESLPKAPDLAVIVSPPDTVPRWIAQLGARGTKAAVVITGGFNEKGVDEGQRLRCAMLDAARPHLLRILGPDCPGIIVPGLHLDASTAHIRPLEGNIALVAQSDAVKATVLDWATSWNIGFSCLMGLGEMADVDFGDMLDCLARESHTQAILLYMEAVTHARKFMSAARAAARIKPVIVLKAARHVQGRTAAAAHSGRLAGPDAVYDAAFRRAGMLRVHDMQELFAAVETLALVQPISGDRLTILTNGGGVGVLATDSLIEEGGRLAELSPETVSRLQAVLPPGWTAGNPVDIGGDASGSRYSEALEAILESEGSDAILVMNCPSAFSSGAETARSLIETLNKSGIRKKGRIVLTNWLGGRTAEEGRRLFTENRIPTYDTPRDAVRAFMQMVQYRRNQDLLMETPPNIPEMFTPDTDKARRVIDLVLSEGRSWLSEPEAKTVLAAYGVPVVSTHVAATPEAAAALAEKIGEPVALKILSSDISHKSEIGGVMLNLRSPESVRKSATVMRARVHEAAPNARIMGFTVQPMIYKMTAHELIIGMTNDAEFGPVLLIGHGGTAVEVVQDVALCLPPLNMHLAREVMARTRICRHLESHNGTIHANMDSIALILVKVSQLICDIAEIDELDINPLLADAAGVIALDARMRVRRTRTPATQRLAIRPYPREHEEAVTMPDGQAMQLRPIRPEDEPAFYKLFASLSPDEIRLRFLHPMRTLPHSLAARLTQIDYDREMALVLAGQSPAGEPEMYGVVHIMADPDNETAEFAILVHHNMTGMGLGSLLLRRILDHARSRGIGEVYGDVSSENKAMLKLCKVFGFNLRREPDDPGVIRVSLKP